jgi:hypothetical protein
MQKLYFTYTTRSLADPFDYEIDFEQNSAEDVIAHYAAYARADYAWHARTRTPKPGQYEHLMAGLRRAVRLGESFKADYCGERIEVQACKVPACGLAREHAAS